MRPRDSSTDDLWSVVSLDELPDDDVLTVAAVIDDDDDDDDEEDMALAAAGDQAPPPPPPTTRTKPVKTKSTRSVVRRNERERNRVKQVQVALTDTRRRHIPRLARRRAVKTTPSLLRSFLLTVSSMTIGKCLGLTTPNRKLRVIDVSRKTFRYFRQKMSKQNNLYLSELTIEPRWRTNLL